MGEARRVDCVAINARTRRCYCRFATVGAAAARPRAVADGSAYKAVRGPQLNRQSLDCRHVEGRWMYVKLPHHCSRVNRSRACRH